MNHWYLFNGFVGYNMSVFLLTLLIVWSLVWKGIALWKAARANQAVWYIILLIVNTVGILEIIYIFLIAPKGHQPAGQQPGDQDKKPAQPE